MIKLRVEEIIKFYDGENPEDKKHSSSITGIFGEDLACCLLQHYFESQDYQVTMLGKKPTEGKKRGKWLDKWIKIEKIGEQVYFQTEIKNWCAHSYGGKPIAIKASESEVVDYANMVFAKQWNNEKKYFKLGQVNKVLKTMKKDRLPDKTPIIEPLICYWFPITDNTENLKPFFTLDCGANIDTIFDKVHVFSMSLYLRKLLSKRVQEITVVSSNVEARLDKMQQMFEIYK